MSCGLQAGSPGCPGQHLTQPLELQTPQLVASDFASSAVCPQIVACSRYSLNAGVGTVSGQLSNVLFNSGLTIQFFLLVLTPNCKHPKGRD
jgi:hypothetical protein